MKRFFLLLLCLCMMLPLLALLPIEVGAAEVSSAKLTVPNGDGTTALNSEACEHGYDNACDTDCNVCGAIREVGTHVGEYVCSESCKYCGAAIEGADHTYANACDTDCNVCGKTREAVHAGQYKCSGICAVCDEEIEPESPHVGVYACNDHCKFCGTELSEYAEHTWDSGEVTKEPTTQQNGEKTFYCTVCGNFKTEELEKLPGAFDEGNGSNTAGNGSDENTVADRGMPVGAVIGIIAGAVLLLGIGGFCLYRFVWREKK